MSLGIGRSLLGRHRRADPWRRGSHAWGRHPHWRSGHSHSRRRHHSWRRRASDGRTLHAWRNHARRRYHAWRRRHWRPHHRTHGRSTSHASARSRKPSRRLLTHGSQLDCSSHRLGLSRPASRSFCYPSRCLRRRSFDAHRDYVLSAEQDQAESSLLLSFSLLGLLWLYLSVLLSVRKHEVHVLVEGYKSADEHTRVLNSDPNPVVDPLQELTAS